MHMAILFNVFMRTLGFFLAILLGVLIFIGISAYTNYQEDFEFDLIRGNVESSNTIFILEINGPIIESESSINDLVGMNIISPETVKNNLDKIITLNPNILIVSINSPGGTVSASNELYNNFKEFKKKSNSKIYFHSSEILASGAYWASLSGEKIYASYGSIVGSIGVKGPDWFYFDKPKLISSGFLGQTIEVENEIEVYSTNAGKSSLMNHLSNRDVAIVSEIAGTTRDVIETHLNIDGYPVIISDTAGIRDSQDEIEKKGIKLALKRAEDADLNIVIIEPKSGYFAGFLKDLISSKSILVINKSDTGINNMVQEFKKYNPICIQKFKY